ncbi:reprolysin-like metallopeptidase [Aquimarina sp. 2201CG1-2-11]|uniref:reprolysin-like metallopeptidase n=1 Tax=Aquimarina discodermiae TaxID=3231043 RepID=UPI0034637B6D
MKTKLLLFVGLLMLNFGFSQTNIWKKSSYPKPQRLTGISSKINTQNKTIYHLNLKALKNALSHSQLRSKSSGLSKTIISFPNESGQMEQYRVTKISVLHPDLSKKFPSIKSYLGTHVNNPSKSIRFSVANDGFHAMILTSGLESKFIDPISIDNNRYVVYTKGDMTSQGNFKCLVSESGLQKSIPDFNSFQRNANDGKLRTYRLAIACTGEYSQFHLNNQGVSSGATDAVKKAAVLSAMNTTMTRVNGVYEKDLGVTMQIVPDNDKIIFLDGNTDNLSNNSAGALINESQAICDSEIGSANYDIGHTFSTGGGGLASLGVVCINGQKARGITGQGNPISDPFDIDYVAHEIGHQFGANHTMNNACGGNRNSSTAVEPGSASSIMGYAGICAPNVQNKSDDHFHAISIQEMWAHVSSTSCATETVTGNNTPTASAGSNFTIPKSTPFVLRGSGTDADAVDILTYNWEQMDVQIATMPPAATSTGGPAFRSISSSTSPDRYMPALATVISGNTASTWEVVPSVARTMNFRLTVRDNHAGGGNTASDDTQITVSGAAGPFVVNSPNTAVSWAANSSQTVTWDVAGTTANGVNAANVDILLSTDGGNTYTVTIATGVPNDGSHDIIVPNNQGTQNRIMVRGSGHLFYDISNANFTITEAIIDTEAPSDPTNLAASNITQTTIDLSWTASTDNIGVVGYDVYQGNTMIAVVSGTAYQVTGLTADTAYSFKVKAKDAADNMSGFSNIINEFTLPVDTEVPSAPTNLTATNPTRNTVDLSWTAATDNLGVTAYDVYEGNTIIATVAGTTHQASGLTVETTYSFRVKAKDAAGNESDFSNAAEATTLANEGCANGITTFPYAESLENVLGDWLQDASDDIDWTLQRNGTPSRNTGPSGAADGTYYAYIEASRNGIGYPTKRAILNGPCFDLGTETQGTFSFQYHMYGSSIGTLTLEISDDNGLSWSSIWTETGDQGNSWKTASIDLAPYAGSSVQLRFNGVTGTSWAGDMAIDNLNLSTAAVACTDVNLAITLDNYPQETSWSITDSNNQVVASGGTYDNQPNGATVNATACLEDGTYTFVINDGFGDGICCQYGNGSYSLTSEGSTIASGGSFGNSESTTFTIGGAAKGIVVEDLKTTQATKITLSPNPVNGNTSTLTISGVGKQVAVSIYDIAGRRVYKNTSIRNGLLRTSKLPNGSYLVKITSDGKISTHKLIAVD